MKIKSDPRPGEVWEALYWDDNPCIIRLGFTLTSSWGWWTFRFLDVKRFVGLIGQVEASKKLTFIRRIRGAE